MSDVKPGVKPSLTLRFVTQSATGANPWWSELGPQLGEPLHLRVHLEWHVTCSLSKALPKFALAVTTNYIQNASSLQSYSLATALPKELSNKFIMLSPVFARNEITVLLTNCRLVRGGHYPTRVH